jgi:hypothetical protein
MKNIEENNRLIAEFVGMQKTDIGWYDYEEILNNSFSNTFDELRFHDDWNWLMKCVEKIEEIEDYRFDFEIRQSLVEVYDKDEHTEVLQEQGDEKMEVTYWCVVEFIKWYKNKNKV